MQLKITQANDKKTFLIILPKSYVFGCAESENNNKKVVSPTNFPHLNIQNVKSSLFI